MVQEKAHALLGISGWTSVLFLKEGVMLGTGFLGRAEGESTYEYD